MRIYKDLLQTMGLFIIAQWDLVILLGARMARILNYPNALLWRHENMLRKRVVGLIC